MGVFGCLLRNHACTPSVPGALGGEGEGAHDALLGQFDLEGVVLVALGAGEGEVGGLAEGFGAGGLRRRGTCSASTERQGLWATPPRARPADLMVPPSISRPAATETRAKA